MVGNYQRKTDQGEKFEKFDEEKGRLAAQGLL